MAVPTKWVDKSCLLWPRASNAKIEQLRISGQTFEGATKKIPAIVCGRFKEISLAEEAVEELSKREVSDVDGKKKRLKPAKKPKASAKKNYNDMIEAQPKVRVINAGKLQPSVPTTILRASGESSEAPSKTVDSTASHDMSFPAAEVAQVVTDIRHSTSFLAAPTQDTMPTVLHLAQENQMEAPMDQTDQWPTSSKMIGGTSPTTLVDANQIYFQDENIVYLQPSDENDISGLQIAGSMSYEQMKADLKVFIEQTVEKSIENAFQNNFARYAALSEIQAKDDSAKTVPDDSVENHAPINDEDELAKWNIKLNNKELQRRYLEYFSKIIIPNAYNQKGNNACYTVVDCLFSREFWTKMTWTGISRSDKAKRGFREYGNVTQLLGDIVRIGDPSYTAQQLELFCRNRLFRYCKSRSTSRRLRKSACRPKRSSKATATVEQNAADADDLCSSDDARMSGELSNSDEYETDSAGLERDEKISSDSRMMSFTMSIGSFTSGVYPR
uniref:DUF4806 domain-containing protein n=1 Tax=Aedes aegypti TaxID=7159 RepID=A0A0P6IXW0_AEDAE